MPRARTVIECRYSTRLLQAAIALAATVYAGIAAAQKPEPAEVSRASGVDPRGRRCRARSRGGSIISRRGSATAFTRATCWSVRLRIAECAAHACPGRAHRGGTDLRDYPTRRRAEDHGAARTRYSSRRSVEGQVRPRRRGNTGCRNVRLQPRLTASRSSRKCRPLNTPHAGQPIIEVVDDRALEVEMTVPAALLGWLKPGTPFQLRVDGRKDLSGKGGPARRPGRSGQPVGEGDREGHRRGARAYAGGQRPRDADAAMGPSKTYFLANTAG